METLSLEGDRASPRVAEGLSSGGMFSPWSFLGKNSKLSRLWAGPLKGQRRLSEHVLGSVWNGVRGVPRGGSVWPQTVFHLSLIQFVFNLSRD